MNKTGFPLFFSYILKDISENLGDLFAHFLGGFADSREIQQVLRTLWYSRKIHQSIKVLAKQETSLCLFKKNDKFTLEFESIHDLTMYIIINYHKIIYQAA